MVQLLMSAHPLYLAILALTHSGLQCLSREYCKSHLPDQTDNLVNMVTEQQTVIDGFLNAYKDGQIGGNVYFLNPYGVLVGETGVINTAA